MEEKKKNTDNREALKKKMSRVRYAQEVYATYDQAQVDAIFFAAAKAADEARIHLAKLAVSETGMGVVEDKVIKNHYAAEYIYHAYKKTKTCGVVEENKTTGMIKLAEPIGVIAAVIPTTNPTSTVIFKILLALKTRNGVIISPHPRAKKCTVETAQIMLEAAIHAGAPKDIIGWIEEPSFESTDFLMKECDFILATGGPAMVRAAYSSGTPAIGVGAGNTPALIDSTADITLAVNSIIHSKTFDNGMICASEQAVIAMEDIYEDVCREFVKRGCYILTQEEVNKVREIMFMDGALNASIVGQDACIIAAMCDIAVPENTKILIGEVERVDTGEVFALEKLSPILALYRSKTHEDALDKAERLILAGGPGHTASVYLNTNSKSDLLKKFMHRMKTCRILVNSPSSQGAIGDIYNFVLAPSLTLGCGSWGGNSVSENVGVEHLLNYKVVAERRENMLWFQTPKKIYIKRGCLSEALKELKDDANKKRVFIVTDSYLYKNGYSRSITEKLSALKIEYTVLFDISPDPTLDCVIAGAEQMRLFAPDCIIAFGGGSAMDAAKIMWLLYEHPEADFKDLALRFMDIRKRIFLFPKLGIKASFVAIPTSAGTGSEVTPFAVITDEKTGIKYPIADYELLPDMAIIDVSFHMSAPKMLTAASGIDALTHALEAYVSMCATDYTDALSLHAIKLIFTYLPRAYHNGEEDIEAREKMANAATMAGMSFSNAFLGICHSMAHKLGASFHLSHGVANALMIEETMRFNASEAPVKMGTFSEYSYPRARSRYCEIASYLGIDGENDEVILERLIAEINILKEKVGILPAISDYVPDEQLFLSQLDIMVEQAFDDQCTGANPRYPLMREIKQMYMNAYYGQKKRVHL